MKFLLYALLLAGSYNVAVSMEQDCQKKSKNDYLNAADKEEYDNASSSLSNNKMQSAQPEENTYQDWVGYACNPCPSGLNRFHGSTISTSSSLVDVTPGVVFFP